MESHITVQCFVTAPNALYYKYSSILSIVELKTRGDEYFKQSDSAATEEKAKESKEEETGADVAPSVSLLFFEIFLQLRVSINKWEKTVIEIIRNEFLLTSS